MKRMKLKLFSFSVILKEKSNKNNQFLNVIDMIIELALAEGNVQSNTINATQSFQMVTIENKSILLFTIIKRALNCIQFTFYMISTVIVCDFQFLTKKIAAEILQI